MDLSEGQRRKREGIERIGENPAEAPWRARALPVLRDLARSGDEFTSEDVTAKVGQPPHPNSVGSLMNTASRQGWIRRSGFVQAERPNQHAALVSRWIGVPDRVPGPGMCSCGRGPVGHTAIHESTDTPGIVRVIREGKTDQYVDLRKAEAEVVAAQRIRQAEARSPERSFVLHPRPVPFFGRLFCPKCGGKGGTNVEPCRSCEGTGYAR
jgi:hypothetical protein